MVITVYFALALQYPEVFLAPDFSSFMGMVLLGFALLYLRSKILTLFPQPTKERKKLKTTADQLRKKMVSDRAKRVKSPAIVVGTPPLLGGPKSDVGVMKFDALGRALPKPQGGGVRQPDGSILYPDGKILYVDGSVRYPDGRLVKADGTVIYPDGRIDAPPPVEEEVPEPVEELADGEVHVEEGQSLEEIKAKLKPKKPKIDVSMLDNSSTYDDKVVLMRMLVAEDSSKVAQVFKKMIQSK
jgi:hypothetical protein